MPPEEWVAPEEWVTPRAPAAVAPRARADRESEVVLVEVPAPVVAVERVSVVARVLAVWAEGAEGARVVAAAVAAVRARVPAWGLRQSHHGSPPGVNSGALGTGATCNEVTGTVVGVVCGNFAATRTFTVNGTQVNCNGGGVAPPAPHNGGYCMQAIAGETLSAYFITF